ncbi:flavin reductase family protein [Streptomyces sp. NPDC048297]|uniref:flavin reductase family protein n=1 Tax=Streptomyces sp. NPDC048297 TaxID=3365531 RepID=UPI0037143F86
MTTTAGTLLADAQAGRVGGHPDPAPAPSPDPAAFRAAMGRMPTGVTLLTHGSGDDTIIMTLNSLISVSLDPLLLLVSVKSDGRMRPRVRRGGGFAVNVLGAEQLPFAQEFCRPDRPEGQAAMLRVGAVEGVSGHAVIPSAEASFECELHDEHEAGDHVLLLGRVVALHQHPDTTDPLLFHRGRYAGLSPLEPAPAGDDRLTPRGRAA